MKTEVKILNIDIELPSYIKSISDNEYTPISISVNKICYTVYQGFYLSFELDKDDNPKCISVISKDEYMKIVEKYRDIIEDEYDIRICSECGTIMDEGYVVNDGSEYYCDDECLHKHYTPEEWEDMCDIDDEDSSNYWTCWY